MTDDYLKKRVEVLTDFDDWDVECESYDKPLLVHNGCCTTQEERLPLDEMLIH